MSSSELEYEEAYFSNIQTTKDWKDQMKFYKMRLAYYVHRYGLKPEDVYNLDQTSVQLNPHANGGKSEATSVRGTSLLTITMTNSKLPLFLLFLPVERSVLCKSYSREPRVTARLEKIVAVYQITKMSL